MKDVIRYIRQSFSYNEKTGVVKRVLRKCRWGVYPCNEVSGTKSQGYYRSVFTVGGKSYSMCNHRIAWVLMTGSFPKNGYDMDHINGIRDDNRWCNLRLAKRGHNNMNSSSKRSDTTSGHKGVHPDGKRWFARIGFNKKIIHLGSFGTFEDAVTARKIAEKRYYGDYARSNV